MKIAAGRKRVDENEDDGSNTNNTGFPSSGSLSTMGNGITSPIRHTNPDVSNSRHHPGPVAFDYDHSYQKHHRNSRADGRSKEEKMAGRKPIMVRSGTHSGGNTKNSNGYPHGSSLRTPINHHDSIISMQPSANHRYANAHYYHHMGYTSDIDRIPSIYSQRGGNEQGGGHLVMPPAYGPSTGYIPGPYPHQQHTHHPSIPTREDQYMYMPHRYPPVPPGYSQGYPPGPGPHSIPVQMSPISAPRHPHPMYRTAPHGAIPLQHHHAGAGHSSPNHDNHVNLSLPILPQYTSNGGTDRPYVPTHDGSVTHGSMGFRSNRIVGPPGANLFIYHLPKDLFDEELYSLFGHHGKCRMSFLFRGRPVCRTWQ